MEQSGIAMIATFLHITEIEIKRLLKGSPVNIDRGGYPFVYFGCKGVIIRPHLKIVGSMKYDLVKTLNKTSDL